MDELRYILRPVPLRPTAILLPPCRGAPPLLPAALCVRAGYQRRRPLSVGIRPPTAAMAVPRTVLPLLLLLAVPLAGQEVFDGRCPKPPVVRKFNQSLYLGHWYQQKKFHYPLYDALKCFRVEYLYPGRRQFWIKIRSVGTNDSLIPNQTYTYMGKLVATKRSGKYVARFREEGGVKTALPKKKRKANYIILDTDYIRYSIVWSCENIEHSENKGQTRIQQNAQHLQILTRSKEALNGDLWMQIKENLTIWKLNPERLEETDQSCP